MPISSLSDQSMVVFNFLPSLTLHPSRFDQYGSAPYAAAAARMPALSAIWHRHWSKRILEREALLEQPVTDLAAAGLAVAVLDAAAVALLARRMGTVLCAARLRHAIAGDAVRALQAALGADVLRLARNGPSMHPGLPGGMFVDAHDAVRTVVDTGYAALYAAFAQAKPEVARRFCLKLPSALHGGPDMAANNGSSTAIDGESAMALAMALAAGSTQGDGHAVSH